MKKHQKQSPEPSQKWQLTGPSALRSSKNRKFVYLLKTNPADSHGYGIPIHIGASKDLNKRFSNDKVVNWWWENYESPVLVEVLGTVREEEAEHVIDWLKTRFAHNGVMLFKNVTVYGAKRLETFSPAERSSYFLSRPSWVSVAYDAVQLFRLKQRVEPGSIPETVVPTVEPTVERLTNPERQELVKVTRQQPYRSKAAVKLAQTLARSYSPVSDLGYYEFWLPGDPNRRKYREQKFKETVKQVSADWRRTRTDTIETGEDGAVKVRVFFQLNANLKRKTSKLKLYKKL